MRRGGKGSIVTVSEIKENIRDDRYGGIDMNITRRENILMTYRHQVPYFLPSMGDVDFCLPNVLEEGPTCIGPPRTAGA